MKSHDIDVASDPALRDLLMIHSPGGMADHFIGQYCDAWGSGPDSVACQLGAELTVKTVPDALKWIAHWDVVARTLPEVSHLVWRNMVYGVAAASERVCGGDLSKYFKTYSHCIEQTRTPLELWQATALEWTPAYFDERANVAPRRKLGSFLNGTKSRRPPPKEHPIWMALIDRCYELTRRPDCVQDAEAYAKIILPLYMGASAYAAMVDLGLDSLACISACRPAEATDLPAQISSHDM